MRPVATAPPPPDFGYASPVPPPSGGTGASLSARNPDLSTTVTIRTPAGGPNGTGPLATGSTDKLGSLYKYTYQVEVVHKVLTLTSISSSDGRVSQAIAS